MYAIGLLPRRVLIVFKFWQAIQFLKGENYVHFVEENSKQSLAAVKYKPITQETKRCKAQRKN